MAITEPTSILITGASSGLGHALALEYAEEGKHLFLTGQNYDRLKQTAEACAAKGAYVKIATFDIVDNVAVARWINDISANRQIDLLIVNAGISGGTSGKGENATQTRDIFSVNIGGTLNTILPAIYKLKKQKSGQIAIISSLAAFRGLPSAPSYSASKAAIKAYGEGLRGELSPHNIGVTVVCPGYIKTPMTEQNHFPMPMIMSAEKTAAKIRVKLYTNPARIAFPKTLYWIINFLAFLPPWMTDKLFNKLPKK